jgi:hypothetical protein
MTPLHCGSWAVEGFRPTFKYSRNPELGACSGLNACNNQPTHCGCVSSCALKGKSIRLGTAMTISGAAVNPNMGYYSSPVVMFLMALFNIRLGWWLGNTNSKGSRRSWLGLGQPYFMKATPTVAMMPLISETFGRTDKERLFLNVSDGGHFENLGLYEMVLRRCEFIIVSDAGADHRFEFDDLANAIERCEVDLGVKIVFDDGVKIRSREEAQPVTAKRRLRKKARREDDTIRFAVGTINYPDGSKGKLLYLKPAFFGDGSEPIELAHYAKAHPTFPHQTTVDQMFDENQFEAYRELGYLTMHDVAVRAGTTVERPLSSMRRLFRGLDRYEQTVGARRSDH